MTSGRSSTCRVAFVALVLLQGFAGSAAAQTKKQFGSIAGTKTKTIVGDNRTFAVIGDFGLAGSRLRDVADLVDAYDPNYVITVGDNNYLAGEAETIDENIGQYYSRFIGSYSGAYGPGALRNNFYPCVGNRDYTDDDTLDPYLDYFTLPGNERYFDFRRGLVHFFFMNSDVREPDGGMDVNGVQAQWLEERLGAVTAAYKVVVLHHRPFVSGSSGSRPFRQWPFEEWGADVVFTGHSHLYERLEVMDTAYFVNGIGGVSLSGSYHELIAGSQSRFADDYGAQFVDVNGRRMRLRLITRDNILMDEHLVFRDDPMDAPDVFVARGATWNYLDDGTFPGPTWTSAAFDDSLWSSGADMLGYEAEGIETTLSYGPDAANPHVTTYLRHEFSASDVASVSNLLLDLRADDGAVVYLNGAEVHRFNMPAGTIEVCTLPLAPLPEYRGNDIYRTELDPADLVSGTNVLAVELHAGTHPGLRAEYFESKDPPSVGTLGDDRRVDATVDFAWAGDAPDGTSITADDEYSERWVGSVYIDAPGDWTFYTTSDDGVELWVDGVNVISNWTAHAETEDSAVHNFASADWYPIRLEHYNDGGTGKIKLEFEHAGYTRDVIPVTHLRTDYDDDSEEPGESDAAFTLRLLGLRGAETFVEKGSDWLYLDDGSTPPSTWIDPSFDDSSWTLGTAQFGYGEGDEATVISYGPDPGHKYITTYFRHTFSVTDASEWGGLFLRLLRDDGAAVYLNGTRVHLVNLSMDGFTGADKAEYEVEDGHESSFFEMRIDHQYLVDGTNTLAVEIHQESKSDVDFSFDLELFGRR